MVLASPSSGNYLRLCVIVASTSFVRVGQPASMSPMPRSIAGLKRSGARMWCCAGVRFGSSLQDTKWDLRRISSASHDGNGSLFCAHSGHLGGTKPTTRWGWDDAFVRVGESRGQTLIERGNHVSTSFSRIV